MRCLPFICLFALSTGLVGISLATEKAGCNRMIVSTVMSPDNAWVALVQEEVCADGAFTTAVTNTVQIARRGEEAMPQQDVFAIDNHGHYENRPRIRWLSSSTVQITVPNKSLIGLHKMNIHDIDIVVKFDPDDPIERERFLRELGLEPR